MEETTPRTTSDVEVTVAAESPRHSSNAPAPTTSSPSNSSRAKSRSNAEEPVAAPVTTSPVHKATPVETPAPAPETAPTPSSPAKSRTQSSEAPAASPTKQETPAPAPAPVEPVQIPAEPAKDTESLLHSPTAKQDAKNENERGCIPPTTEVNAVKNPDKHLESGCGKCVVM